MDWSVEIFEDLLRHRAHLDIFLGVIAAVGFAGSGFSPRGFAIFIWLGGVVLLIFLGCSAAIGEEGGDGLGEGLVLFGLMVAAVVWTVSVALGKFVRLIVWELVEVGLRLWRP